MIFILKNLRKEFTSTNNILKTRIRSNIPTYATTVTMKLSFVLVIKKSTDPAEIFRTKYNVTAGNIHCYTPHVLKKVLQNSFLFQ